MKILLVNLSKMIDDTGGTAKVNCTFASEMVRRGYEVASIYSDDKDGKFFFPIDEKVRLYNLRRYEGKVQKLPLRYRIMRELVRGFSKKQAATINEAFTEKYLVPIAKDIIEKEKPDCLVCFQPAAAKVCLIDLKTKIPVILMAHGNTEDWFHYYPSEQVPAIGMCRVVQVLVPSFTEPITSRFPNTKTIEIGNVVPQFSPNDLSREKSGYKIIFIARLAKNHKRPHLLVKAFIKIADRFPDWSVEIYGAEDTRGYKKEMQNEIDAAKLTDRILLKGTTTNVEEVLAEGDLFVFPSAAEGFGLTIAEAMSKGIPGIAYKNCAAVNEIVESGIDGLLDEDGIDPLARAMEKLMSDRDLRVKMGKAAHEAMKKYSAEIIWDKWDELLHEIVGK